MSCKTLFHGALGGALLLSACGESPVAPEDRDPVLDPAVLEETGLAGPLRESVPEGERAVDGKADINGQRGPQVAAGAATEVWAVTRSWDDVENEAGIAWDANAGLDWEQKFDAWVGAMEPIARQVPARSQTFEIRTPFGERVLPAPTLECAEVALLLRVTFASWHGLPFFMQGWDANGRQSLYAGHFGVINRSGQVIGRFPAFRTRYRDYTGEWSPGDEWPQDSRLRSYRLDDDDGVPFIGEDAGAGAYFDELFLNKRVGYFARLLLLYFGSVNLVDEANMFHIAPEATRAGDVLLHRWQRRGIGHVIPVVRHNVPAPNRLELWVASGSMPRRQPLWEEPQRARGSFTNDSGGGTGSGYSGDAYWELGGGIRRWRTAVLRDGRWRNVVREADQSNYIAPTDEARISERPDRFEEVLAEVTLEEQLAVALDQVNAARLHLRSYPASCAARTRREDAFETVYELNAAIAGATRAETDEQYRLLEDYVFSELDYESSRTCCWNRSTAAMADVILDYAEAEQAEAEVNAMCMAPTVFRAELQGYNRWLTHADEIGQPDVWQPWSEDESCNQRDVEQDTVANRRTITDFCALPGDVEPMPEPEPEPEPEPDPADTCDALGSDDSVDTAIPLDVIEDAQICTGDEDFYLIEGGGTVVVTFNDERGDLDVEALSLEGTRVDLSADIDDDEEVSHDATFVVRVYGYNGATNSYVIQRQ
ncbi:MAG: hypothetical protein AAF411_14305 [Myxococcota bacterium]